MDVVQSTVCGSPSSSFSNAGPWWIGTGGAEILLDCFNGCVQAIARSRECFENDNGPFQRLFFGLQVRKNLPDH